MSYRGITENHVTVLNGLKKLSGDKNVWVAPGLLTAPTKLALPTIKEVLKETCGRWITKMSTKGEYRFSIKGLKEMKAGISVSKAEKAPTAPKIAKPTAKKPAKAPVKAPSKIVLPDVKAKKAVKVIEPAKTAVVKKFVVKKPAAVAPAAEGK